MHANELTRYFFLIGGQPVIFEISKQLPPPVLVPVGAPPGLPTISVPAKRSRNHPCTVIIDGKQRHVSGAVAGVLARLEAGEREVDMRAECSARLAAEVPEVFRMLRRLEHRKTLAKREWWGL